MEQLTGPSGPKVFTAMLRQGGHLPVDVKVLSVENQMKEIKDGVKGEKALLKVSYSSEVKGPL